LWQPAQPKATQNRPQQQNTTNKTNLKKLCIATSPQQQLNKKTNNQQKKMLQNVTKKAQFAFPIGPRKNKPQKNHKLQKRKNKIMVEACLFARRAFPNSVSEHRGL
jgi:hypothetical protein